METWFKVTQDLPVFFFYAYAHAEQNVRAIQDRSLLDDEHKNKRLESVDQVMLER